MTTAQPRWRYLANLGDTDPIENGGYFIFEDRTGQYEATAEYLTDDGDDGPRSWTVYRIELDRLKTVREELPNGSYIEHLVPDHYDAATRPHPASVYRPWFADKLPSVAASCDYPVAELRADLCSADPIRRAHAYRAIYDVEGWENGDSYPLTFTRRGELTRRYRTVLRHVQDERRGIRPARKAS